MESSEEQYVDVVGYPVNVDPILVYRSPGKAAGFLDWHSRIIPSPCQLKVDPARPET